MACDDTKDNENNGDFYIEFDKEEIKLNAIEGTSESIIISSSSTWGLDTDLPDWITISNFVGPESSMPITITANGNNSQERREAILVFGNANDISKSIKVIQLGLADSDPFLKLNETQIFFSLEGETKSVELTANIPWVVTSFPAWLTISPTSGDKSSRVILAAENNDQMERREAMLVFTSKDGKQKGELAIIQPGRQDVLQSPHLPIFRESMTSYSSNGHYDVTMESLFVNATIKKNIYLGNMIKNKSEIYPDFSFFNGYTFNPITVSVAPIAGNLTEKTFIPSLQEQETFAGEVLANPPRQHAGGKVSYLDATPYLTHRVLHSIGLANLGIALDEIVSGTSYTKQEMTRKSGLIFSFKHTLFTLDMDIPEKLIEGELKDADQTIETSYINSMGYGKIGLLVIESDAQYEKIKSAVSNALHGTIDDVRQAEYDALIEASDITYVYFNNKNEVQVNKNRREAIDAYKAAGSNRKDRENIYPVEFTLSNFNTHATDQLKFSFEAPREQ